MIMSFGEQQLIVEWSFGAILEIVHQEFDFHIYPVILVEVVFIWHCQYDVDVDDGVAH